MPAKGSRFPAEPLTSDEARRLIAACSRRAPTGRRNAALIATMYRSGLRVSEALGLDLRDLDRHEGTLRIRRGKGNKARTVGIDPGALALIEVWLSVRPGGAGPLFCNLGGGRLLPSYVRGMLPRMARRASISKRCHPHGLRHSCAAEMAGEGVPVHMISKVLGHANVAVTSRYIDHLRPQDVVDAMVRRQW